eukprot:jgi/Undpi1/2746/HiC_scaffold_14.g06124.m1
MVVAMTLVVVVVLCCCWRGWGLGLGGAGGGGIGGGVDGGGGGVLLLAGMGVGVRLVLVLVTVVLSVVLVVLEGGGAPHRRVVDKSSSAGESPVIVNADEPFVSVKSWVREKPEYLRATPMLGREAALLVICANRADYLDRALTAVRKYHPGSSKGVAFALPVIISQDGGHPNVAGVISRFKDSMAHIAPVVHIRHTPPHGENRGYYKLSAHYKWALSQAFDELEAEGDYNFALVNNVIILEEDLAIAPDFFEYFSAMAPLLDSDETLMAVSAWNDNGQAANVKDTQALVRTDFFPGLGWMLPRRVWDEVSVGWPAAYWDDWMREPMRRKDRQFIRPEVCRTYHFGKKGGASNNQFGPQLDNIRLNEVFVPFREMDLSYLRPDVFRSWFGGSVRNAQTASAGAVKSMSHMPPEVVVEYSSEKEFQALARQLGVMQDFKAGVPRTAYMGVVSLWVGNTKVYLAPRSFKAR